MNYETITTDIDEDVIYIIPNRPEQLNLFGRKLGEELYRFFHKINRNKEIRIVVINDAGIVFCGGRDIKEIHTAEDKSQFLRDLTKPFHKCEIKMRNMEKLMIASVNNTAFGIGLLRTLAYGIIQVNA